MVISLRAINTLVLLHSLSSIAFSCNISYSRKNQILWARVTRNPHANWVWLEYVFAQNYQALWGKFSLGSNFICMKVCVSLTQSLLNLVLRFSWDCSFILQERKNLMLWYQRQRRQFYESFNSSSLCNIIKEMPNMLNHYYETTLSQFFMVPFRRILGTHNPRFMALALILACIHKYVRLRPIWGINPWLV